MPVIDWIFGSLLFLYMVILCALYAGFRRLYRQLPAAGSVFSDQELPRVSIVVAARNEEQNLPKLLPCLLRQDYPRDRLEIVIVDDRSEDDTWNILADAKRQHPHLNAVRVTERLPDYAPKKRALDAGIRTATGEILLLTDADCLPPPTWVRSTVRFYRDDVSVVAGYSPYVYPSATPPLIRGMLSLDCFAFAAVSAASAGWGQPLTATGTNLSYRRETYFAAGGFEPIKQWISGDDDLFMRHLAQRRLGAFSYSLDPDAYVPTIAPTSWRQFWHQRIRFGSKGRHQRPFVLLCTIGVYLLNVLLVFGAVSFLLGSAGVLWSTVVAWGLKSLIEFCFLFVTARKFKETALLKYFIPTAMVHPFYISVFGFLGLAGNFRWKGEAFQ